MKTLFQTLAFIGLFTTLSFKTLEVFVSEKDGTKFLLEAVDARMMDREEGKLAAERGTTAEIKAYGKLMVKDQTMLLGELGQIADAKKISMPTKISDEKMKALNNLKEKNGKDFDKKFLNMIKIDHKRDVKEFRDASENCEDKQIKQFASKRLSMIQSHLDGVEKIKDEN